MAYGGLSARTVARLDALADEEEARAQGKPRRRITDRPVAGTRLVREWQGIEHHVTVLVDGFEYQGRTREALSEGYDTCPVRSVPAAEVEAAVITQLRAFIRSPELVARTWAAVRERGDETISEREVLQALTDFESLWDELFHGEPSRVVQLLVERVDVQPDGIEVRIRTEGFRSLIEELGGGQDIQKKDAA